MYYFGKPPYPISVTTISDTQVLMRSEVKDVVLTVIKLDFPEDYHRELAHLKQAALKPSLEILETRCYPKRVRPGDAFRFLVDYRVVEDPQYAGSPLLFSYSIEKEGQVLFSSRPAKIVVASGEDKQRRVDLLAAREEGEYQIFALFECGNMEARDTFRFIIDAQAPPPDTRPVEERLVGRYASVMGGSATGTLHLFLENGSLKGRIALNAKTAKYWIYTIQAMALRQGILWMRVLMKSPTLNMYAIMEDEVSLNDELNYMPVRTVS